jgi:hypothetical protein
MRILGEGPNGGQENACARARKWIHDHGGVTHVPSWGKIWLSVYYIIFLIKNRNSQNFNASIYVYMLLT